MTDSPWLTVKGAAAYSTLSIPTIERLVAAELLASSKVGGRRVIHRDDVDRYLRSGRTASNVKAARRRGADISAPPSSGRPG